VNGGTSIGPSLAAGSYTIDGASCGGLGLIGSTASDYMIAYTGATFTVTPAPLTVDVPSVSAHYGNVPATFTPTYDGLENGETAPATPARCTSSNATDTSPPGSYNITCSGAQDSNYTISYRPANGIGVGALTITKAPTGLVAARAKTGLLSLTFSATLTRTDNSAAISGKTIAFSVQGQRVCQATTDAAGVARCTVIGIAIGSGSYTASFAGDADYLSSSGTASL
jgi:hypothetical protein